MVKSNSSARDYVYPSIAEFEKGERLRHSYYGEGSVLEVVRKGDSEILVVELDDKNQTPIGVASSGRSDFDPWRGRKDILRLKFVASSGVVGVKPAEAVGIKGSVVVGVRPSNPVGVKPGAVGVKPGEYVPVEQVVSEDVPVEQVVSNEPVGVKPGEE